MSLGYISLWRLQDGADQVDYEVRSCDFSIVPGQEVLIGYLSIERGSGTYSFVAAGELAGMLVMPPNLFELEPEEVSRQLKSTYAGHDALPWMRRLSFVARHLIKEDKYPQRYPGGMRDEPEI